jgi:DNA-binding response OmpR family regulator
MADGSIRVLEIIVKRFTVEELARKIRDVLDSRRTNRVLVVEDEFTVRSLAVELLSSNGYAADEAANSAEALSKVRAAQGHHGAVMLDEGLPDKSGHAVTIELRALYADLPILITSGEHGIQLKERFANDRFTEVIGKPYTGALLLHSLKEKRQSRLPSRHEFMAALVCINEKYTACRIILT